jgi:hypothetical protein
VPRFQSLSFALLWAFIALATAAASGCAAVKASRQPDKKDLGVLHQGVPRTHVVAELGRPEWTRERDGVITDVFSFKQGYSKGVKASRALVHGAADVVTGGLWEVIGIPAETLADGTDVQVVVTYDDLENVRAVQVVKGQKVLEERRGLFARRSKSKSNTTLVSSRRKSNDG